MEDGRRRIDDGCDDEFKKSSPSDQMKKRKSAIRARIGGYVGIILYAMHFGQVLEQCT